MESSDGWASQHAEEASISLLQALLLDPIVDGIARAEQMLDDMLELQEDYLPKFT